MEFLLSAPARFEAVVPQHRAPEKKTMTRSARCLSISRQRDLHSKAEPARNAHGALTPNARGEQPRASECEPAVCSTALLGGPELCQRPCRSVIQSPGLRVPTRPAESRPEASARS